MLIVAEQLADYDPWGRPGVGVGPAFNRPAPSAQQNPPSFQPIQSQVSVEPPTVPALKLEEVTILKWSELLSSIGFVLAFDRCNRRGKNRVLAIHNLISICVQRLAWLKMWFIRFENIFSDLRIFSSLISESTKRSVSGAY